MKAIVFFMLLAVGIVTAKNITTYDLRNGPEYFEAFVNKYNKQYDNEAEKAKRYDIFLQTLEKINILNRDSEHARYGINKLSDLTKEEMEKYKGYVRSGGRANGCTAQLKSGNKTKNYNKRISDFDWRDYNVVTEVKDQSQCGSCWAFSAIANVESVYAMKTHKRLDLSEQQVVDCDTSSDGCFGGIPSYALEYIAEQGSMLENDYPYVAKDQECQYDDSNIAVNIAGCATIDFESEEDIKFELVFNGPISIAMATDSLGCYQEGIIMGAGCYGTFIDHALLLVGFGTEDGIPYWIIKNSWGSSWGEDGYLRIHRGVNCLRVTEYEMVTAVIN